MALISSAAFAAPSFKIYEVAVPNSKRAAVLEATDTFMKSAKGKTYNGGLRVNTILAKGISPATHTFILLMDSMAAIEEWETSLIGEPDITTFGAALEENSTPSSKYMSRMMETWGNISNDNRTWLITRFRTTDPMAVVKEQDKLDKATKGKFPGQIVLHSIPVGSRTEAKNDYSTLMLVAGYESIAEKEN